MKPIFVLSKIQNLLKEEQDKAYYEPESIMNFITKFTSVYYKTESLLYI